MFDMVLCSLVQGFVCMLSCLPACLAFCYPSLLLCVLSQTGVHQVRCHCSFTCNTTIIHIVITHNYWDQCKQAFWYIFPFLAHSLEAWDIENSEHGQWNQYLWILGCSQWNHCCSCFGHEHWNPMSQASGIWSDITISAIWCRNVQHDIFVNFSLLCLAQSNWSHQPKTLN